MPQVLFRSIFCFKSALVFALAAVSIGCVASAQVQTNSAQSTATNAKTNLGSPAETVREFYGAMRDKRFREAFLLTNWRAAVESLTTQDIETLREDVIEPLAEQTVGIEVSGEQISGERASVFVKSKIAGATNNDKVELRRENGAWVIVMGDKQTEETVRREGKNYFFNVLIEMRHADAQAALQEIVKAEFVHGLQNGGAFADLPALVSEKLLSPDLLNTSTGYQFRLKISGDGKKYTVNAEPAEYGKTGKLSFLLESGGAKDGTSRIKSDDKKGQPLNP